MGCPRAKFANFGHLAQVVVYEISIAVLINFGLWLWRHYISPASVDICMISTALLFFGLYTAVLIFGQCMHKISAHSSASKVVNCAETQLCHVLFYASTGLVQPAELSPV